MTLVGKTLVFLNLLFSLATAALIAVVFSTRTNWKTEYEKMKNLALVAEAAYKGERTQHENESRAKDEQVAALQRERDGLKNDVAEAQKRKADAEAQLASSQSMNTQETKNLDLLKTEVQNLKQERDQIAGEKAQKEAMIINLTKAVNDHKRDAVQNEVNYKTTLAQLDKLMASYEQVVKENSALKFQTSAPSNGGARGTEGAGSVLDRADAPPPPKDVRALITAVNEQGLAQIDVGSDSGISPGNVLFVRRLDLKNPAASVYLGTLTIRTVNNKAAVGQFKSESRERLPKVGDEVAASVTGR
jgi:hypothetical protein